MGKEFNKESFSYLDEEGLLFSKEDREKTWNKIKRNNNKKRTKNSMLMLFGKRYVTPIVGTLMVLLLAIGVLLPTLFSGNDLRMQGENDHQKSQSESISFSVLLIGEEPISHRNTLNILLTYNSGNNSIKLVPIPHDVYVNLYNSEGEMIGEDKLTHTLAYDSEPESVLITVSDLFNIPIDYYAVFPSEDMYQILEISDQEKSTYHDQDIVDLVKERLTFSEIKSIISENKTNMTEDIYNRFQMDENRPQAIQVLNLVEGIEEKYIDDVYYLDINQSVLNMTSQTLKQHLGKQ
ncbi:hypothetical protein GMD78_19775 [Ornithinibacillus sp. L9]|uniref:Cell envelope-related transcriptional attenuator domain-containing protein n=1 Tax=Ornithinibacillus caprae TaxID=2678566 RepID=A0A6N8FLT4_9BACI|nr:LCP family protein [Ornithinibacillus caprae]MUK90600.1 hypothetical protein [Ornithinibacillus caprae]